MKTCWLQILRRTLYWMMRSLESTCNFERVYSASRGCGASCIYPLLGCRLHPNWKFHGIGKFCHFRLHNPIDIQPQSIECAQSNITLNGLQTSIDLHLIKKSDPFVPGEIFTSASISFIMCNPPFYSTNSQRQCPQTVKERPPHSVCMGSDMEMTTEGGEVEFVKKLIHQSQEFSSHRTWCTSLIGHKSSFTTLVTFLRSMNARVIRSTSFHQGSTSRWFLAWKFWRCCTWRIKNI